MPVKLIPYRRVSTVKQGESGLGLEAQDAAIEAYRKGVGGQIVSAYTEVETGKRDEMTNRPELVKAIAHAKRSRATLVIAKLDRLSRSVYVTASLHKAGVEFVACDNPHANRLTIQILAVVAENEARMISDRTKAALKAYRDTGRVSKRIRLLYPDGVPPEIVHATAGKLGASLPQCRNLTPEARAIGVRRSTESRKAAAIASVQDLAPDMLKWWNEGLSLRAISARLNAEGQTTRMEKSWSPMAVKRALDRIAPDRARSNPSPLNI